MVHAPRTTPIPTLFYLMMGVITSHQSQAKYRHASMWSDVYLQQAIEGCITCWFVDNQKTHSRWDGPHHFALNSY
ncbi:uncharacterized protein LY79DRAFT_555205 [Colletotrichum navitas]|uniref:Uncharacterized protein n=1 Tax=Colletotrichum navitas TaxID=681940 RepID=A0AAD8PY27_9PEZI|nr:uncharacterized protein LY79DRAFT_555205 [Colletotrichum navitas]KAK1590141.1 hypothetical protein LY79DRAFT_555205 [Colletotrichum navitas]